MKDSALTPDQIIQTFEKRWAEARMSKNASLYQLSILRELSRSFHAEKSWCLASGYPEEAEDCHGWEDKVESLISGDRSSGTLAETVKNADPGMEIESPKKKSAKELPKELYELIPPEKLDRYDRNWEKAIATEAATLRWEFWRLNASVKVEDAQACEDALGKAIGAHGIILFADTAENSGLQEEFKAGVWPGQWVLVIEPGFDCKSIALGKIKGLVVTPSPPQWTLLYR